MSGATISTEATSRPQDSLLPRWKTGKPDAVLAAARDQAYQTLLEMTEVTAIGEYLGVKKEADRLVTHLFECQVPGYQGWQWFVVLGRAPRAQEAKICELGLLPSAAALLAPPWVPVAERKIDSEQSTVAPKKKTSVKKTDAKKKEPTGQKESVGQKTASKQGATQVERASEQPQNREKPETPKANEKKPGRKRKVPRKQKKSSTEQKVEAAQ